MGAGGIRRRISSEEWSEFHGGNRGLSQTENREDVAMDWSPGTENATGADASQSPKNKTDELSSPTKEDWLKSTRIGWTERGVEARKVFNPHMKKECWYTLSSYDGTPMYEFNAYLEKPDIVEKLLSGVKAGYKTVDGKEVMTVGEVPCHTPSGKLAYAWKARHMGGRLWTDFVPLERDES